MAEISRLITSESVSLKLQDGTGSPISKEIKTVGPVVFPLTLPKKTGEEFMVQNGGTSEIFDAPYNGIESGMDLKFTVPLVDPLNVTAADKATIDILRKLHNNQLLSTMTSTSPLSSQTRFTLDAVITLKKAGGPSTDQVATAAGYVSALGETKTESGGLAIEVTFRIIEEWTWS